MFHTDVKLPEGRGLAPQFTTMFRENDDKQLDFDGVCICCCFRQTHLWYIYLRNWRFVLSSLPQVFQVRLSSKNYLGKHEKELNAVKS